MKRYREDLQIKNASVVHRWSEDFSRKFHAIPFQKDQGTYFVAVDKEDQKELELALKEDLGTYRFFHYSRIEILRCINLSYGILYGKDDLKKQIYNWIEEADAGRIFQCILDEALHLEATDIHIWFQEGFYSIQFRLQGILKTFCTLEKETGEALSRVVKVWGKMEISTTLSPRDGRISYLFDGRHIDIRVSLVPAISGEKIHLRLLNAATGPDSLDDLPMTSRERELLNKYLNKDQGYLIICGPTGSGKTSTMRCCLKALHLGDKHILSLEDPVEYIIKGITQIQVDEERGNSFAALLRSALRQDPDIIALGEVRDFKSADVSIKASLTGHLMLGTMHTKSARTALERIIDLGISPYLAVSAIRLIINQRLVKLLCPHCKVEYGSSQDIKALNLKKGQRVFRALGCDQCNYTGYSGRTAVLELLHISDSSARAYIENRELEISEDFLPIFEKLKGYVQQGEISPEEALSMLEEDMG